MCFLILIHNRFSFSCTHTVHTLYKQKKEHTSTTNHDQEPILHAQAQTRRRQKDHPPPPLPGHVPPRPPPRGRLPPHHDLRPLQRIIIRRRPRLIVLLRWSLLLQPQRSPPHRSRRRLHRVHQEVLHHVARLHRRRWIYRFCGGAGCHSFARYVNQSVRWPSCLINFFHIFSLVFVNLYILNLLYIYIYTSTIVICRLVWMKHK